MKGFLMLAYLVILFSLMLLDTRFGPLDTFLVKDIVVLMFCGFFDLCSSSQLKPITKSKEVVYEIIAVLKKYLEIL
jgi:hypothetical protein